MKLDIRCSIKKNANRILLLVPLVAFAVPFLWLYLLNPVSFDTMWKGRTFQLFFIWLIMVELILGWENLQRRGTANLTKLRFIALLVSLVAPSVYVFTSNFLGLNSLIIESSKQAGIYWNQDMPAAIEYIVFAGFFSFMVFLIQGLNGLRSFSIPILFSCLIGAVFIIDSVYPNEQFTPFQFLVPATTMLAANTLNAMGYKTALNLGQGNLPQLTVTDPNNLTNSVSFGIAWPCAGIESLLIFGVTIILFLKRMPISWQAKLGYFVVGAGITYIINILRIVSIFLFVLGGGELNVFHQSYGPLYPIVWIVSYPLIILAIQNLWGRIKNRNKDLRRNLEEPVINSLGDRNDLS